MSIAKGSHIHEGSSYFSSEIISLQKFGNLVISRFGKNW